MKNCALILELKLNLNMMIKVYIILENKISYKLRIVGKIDIFKIIQKFYLGIFYLKSFYFIKKTHFLFLIYVYQKK